LSKSKELAELFIENHNWNSEFFQMYHIINKKRGFGLDNSSIIVEAIEYCLENDYCSAASDLSSGLYHLNNDLALSYLKRLAPKNCYCAFVYATFCGPNHGNNKEEWIQWNKFSADNGHILARRRMYWYNDNLSVYRKIMLKINTVIIAIKDYQDIRLRNWMQI